MLAAYRRTHSPSHVSWSEGRRPLGSVGTALHSSNEPSELLQWPGHDDSTINIVVGLLLLLLWRTYSYLLSLRWYRCNTGWWQRFTCLWTTCPRLHPTVRDQPNSRFHGRDISVKLAVFHEKRPFPWNSVKSVIFREF